MTLSVSQIRKSIESGMYLSVTFRYRLRQCFFRESYFDIEYNNYSDCVTVHPEGCANTCRHIPIEEFKTMKKREFNKVCREMISK